MYNNLVKDWFYFSRMQRKGIIVLLLLIGMIPLLSQLAGSCERQGDIDMESFFRQVSLYDSLVAAMEAGLARDQDQPQREKTREVSRQSRLVPPGPFDPNSISRDQWESMGVPVHLARSIGNYLAAGGSFRFKEDLQRLYLMEDHIYEQLAGFIELPERADVKPASEGIPPGRADTQRLAAREDVPLLVQLNRADSTELTSLRGIGPVFSRRIVRYRELLGGYHDSEQLLEVFGMDSLRYEGIKPYVVADTLAIRQIDLNEAAFADLVRHPYIDRQVANAILNLRQQHGLFSCPSDINRSYLVCDSLWKRLSPYLKASGQ